MVLCGTGVLAAPAPVEEITGVWDQTVRKLPGTTVLDATLKQAVAGADLRLQLLSWKGRFLGGRAWVDGQDRLPRAVWVVEDKDAVLRVNVGMPGEHTPKGAPCEGCLFDLKLTNGVGTYRTPGADTDALPWPATEGAVTAGSGGPKLRAGNEAELLPGAAELLRLYRALDLVMAQGVEPADAWKAGRVVAPECQLQKTVTTKKPTPKLPSLDEGEEKPKTESPVVDEAKLAMARGTLTRMSAVAKAWVPGAVAPADTSTDPDFGPWYGHGLLVSNALPVGAQASGSPQWLAVGGWRYVGPFPANLPAVVSRGLPEFFDNDCAQYATDIEALQRDGETPPAMRLVTWQHVEDQIEAGLQRPWTKSKPGRHGSGSRGERRRVVGRARRDGLRAVVGERPAGRGGGVWSRHRGTHRVG
jgi:hypothetical protein